MPDFSEVTEVVIDFWKNNTWFRGLTFYGEDENEYLASVGNIDR